MPPIYAVQQPIRFGGRRRKIGERVEMTSEEAGRMSAGVLSDPLPEETNDAGQIVGAAVGLVASAADFLDTYSNVVISDVSDNAGAATATAHADASTATGQLDQGVPGSGPTHGETPAEPPAQKAVADTAGPAQAVKGKRK